MQLLAQINQFNAPVIDWWAAAPFLAPVLGALLLLLVSSLSPKPVPIYVSTIVTLVTSAVTAIFAYKLWDDFTESGPRLVLGNAVVLDGFAIFFMFLLALVVAVGALFAHSYALRERLSGHEMLALLLVSMVGAMVMASSNELITFFVGLETLSLGLYVLAAMHMRRRTSQEAAIKYFILGALASAVLLYGIALTYGATGTTNLLEISAFLNSTIIFKDAMLLLGIAMILIGLAFKVSAAPFHMWAPDVYQGAPTPLAGYMAAIAKIGGFAALLRILVVAFDNYSQDWTPVLAVLAAASLVVGSFMAIVQVDIKRMLAYSSVAHAGFILVAVQSNTVESTAAVLFYLFTYSLMVLGSFGVVGLVSGEGDGATSLADIKGLGHKRPALALAFTVLLLSQAGVPLTAGFLAKFQAIQAAVEARTYWLAIVAMLSAVVAAYLYLRIIAAMYMFEADEAAATSVPIASSAGLALLVVIGVTLFFGVIPGPLMDFASDALLGVLP